jgi:hypothetical protein
MNYLKSIIFWDIMPCSRLGVNRSFGGIYRLHLQDRGNKFSKKPKSKQVVLFITTAVKTSNPTMNYLFGSFVSQLAQNWLIG